MSKKKWLTNQKIQINKYVLYILFIYCQNTSFQSSFTENNDYNNIFKLYTIRYKQLFEIYIFIYIYIYIYIYSPMQVYCMRIKLDILIFAILYKELANNIVTICKKLLKCIVLCFMWVYCMNTNKIGYNTVCAMAECYNCLYLSFFINNCLVCIWGNWIINWISGKPWRLWK